MEVAQTSRQGGGGGTMETVADIKKRLFRAAMKGKWDTVVDVYAKNRSVQEVKITRSEDTVLHVAVSDGQKEIVKQLVDAVVPTDAERILGLRNEKGNTPLHLAAVLGMVEVCAAMAKKCPRLVVEARNMAGETPLYLATKYGKTYAFFALQDAIDSRVGVYSVHDLAFCRRNDGNTILHQAISGEHFDLALEIIYLYEGLVNFNNERGETPLHRLANKPYVFRSGSRFGLFDSLIYSCTFVDPLEVKYPRYKGKAHFDSLVLTEESAKFPENYKTCFDGFELLKHVYNTVVSSFNDRSVKKCYIADEEDPDEEHIKHSRSSSQKNLLIAPQGASQSEQTNQETYDMSNQLQNGPSNQRWFPQNYETCFDLFKLAMKIVLVFLGIGLWRTQEIAKKKRKHIYAYQIMDELVTRSLNWEYEKDGKRPDELPLMASQVSLPKDRPSIDDSEPSIDNPDKGKDESQNKEPATKSNGPQGVKEGVDQKNKVASSKEPDGVTPILVAAKRGVIEMVEKILDSFPVAVQDMDSNDKNIVLLAVEHRQPNVYKLMLKRKIMRESVFGRVDKEGNCALHLAATLGQTRPWIIPGAALQMQWEIKWYKFVLKSMDPEFFPQYNNDGKTARDIFTEKHEQLVKDGGTWLNNTSQSCSVVAALIATVAFASATTVPGGVNQESGFPTLEGKPAFQIFAISALVALCFSVTSLIMFLSILTSRYQEWDFESDLPVKLILGLTSLFMSIASMLVSFFAGHFFVVEKKLKYVTFPIYAVMCLPLTFFAFAQFPLYVDLIKATFARVPERTEKMRAF